MAHAQQIAVGGNGLGEGVLTYHADGTKAGANGLRSAVAVGQEDVFPHFIAWADGDRIALEFGENPDFLSAGKAAGGLQLGLTGLKERIEPIEGIDIL